MIDLLREFIFKKGTGGLHRFVHGDFHANSFRYSSCQCRIYFVKVAYWSMTDLFRQYLPYLRVGSLYHMLLVWPGQRMPEQGCLAIVVLIAVSSGTNRMSL